MKFKSRYFIGSHPHVFKQFHLILINMFDGQMSDIKRIQILSTLRLLSVNIQRLNELQIDDKVDFMKGCDILQFIRSKQDGLGSSELDQQIQNEIDSILYKNVNRFMKIEQIVKIDLKGLVRSQQMYMLVWMNQAQNVYSIIQQAESEDVIRLVGQLLMTEEQNIVYTLQSNTYRKQKSQFMEQCLSFIFNLLKYILIEQKLDLYYHLVVAVVGLINKAFT